MGNYVRFSLTPGEPNDLRRYVPDDTIRTIWVDAADDSEIEAGVEEIIGDVEAEIDSRLAQHYVVPFADPPPPAIVGIACVLVAEAVYLRSNG